MSFKEPIFVAAIDVGTAFSGFAFSSKVDYQKTPLKIQTNNWNSGARGLITRKTPTVLLLNKDTSFRAFGFEAERCFADLSNSDSDSDSDEEIAADPKEDPKDLYYFHEFTKELHNVKTWSPRTLIEDINGKTLPATKVFSECIGYLKRKIFTYLTDNYRGILHEKEVLYVLTVAAMWDDTAKEFMLQAGKMAGIPERNFEIASEPESGFMYCLLQENDSNRRKLLDPGAVFMVADMGGETTKISVHRRLDDGSIQELRPVSGGPRGGNAVNEAFMTLMEDICGPGNIQKLRENYLLDYIELFSREFENKKRSTVRPESIVAISIPYSLNEIIKSDKTLKSFINAVQKSKYASKGVYFKEGSLKMFIPYPVFKSLFTPTVAAIVDHIKEIVRERLSDKLKVILMVGGFSTCEFVHKEVETAFVDKRIIVPEDAELAVLKGAVLFGHIPTFTPVRYCFNIAAFTYGIQHWPKFDAAKHPQSKMVVMKNKEVRCKDVFLKLVKKGQRLDIDHEVKRTFQILQTGAESLECQIYKSDHVDPQFIDDPDVSLLGTLEVPLGNEESIHIEETFIFKKNALRLIAKDLGSGQQVAATYSYT